MDTGKRCSLLVFFLSSHSRTVVDGPVVIYVVPHSDHRVLVTIHGVFDGEHGEKGQIEKFHLLNFENNFKYYKLPF